MEAWEQSKMDRNSHILEPVEMVSIRQVSVSRARQPLSLYLYSQSELSKIIQAVERNNTRAQSHSEAIRRMIEGQDPFSELPIRDHRSKHVVSADGS